MKTLFVVFVVMKIFFVTYVQAEMGLDRRYLDRRYKIKWIAERGSGTKFWIGDPRSKI